ncbi:type I-B CRISPR-associated protein Cas7/Cst2/DevR [Candidatus Woesearchaeota archaeon]|nr:type I-B CRISPR-associated protein Cas7/Cst2/DevR [Candidatus Woesearchaeota archaeon]
MKLLELAYLTRIENANINSNSTEGNIATLKKTEDFDGKQRVYVSGVSLKYAFKEYWKSKGVPISDVLSKKDAKATEKEKEEASQVSSSCDISFIDDDLFGYMNTNLKKTRVAPVKTNGLISLYEYKGDINRGVRYDPKGTNHSLYDIEVSSNLMRGNFAIELDRIGVDESDDKEIDDKYKKKHFRELIEAVFNSWGGGKQTNFLTKTSPEFMIAVIRRDKALTIFDRLWMDENKNIDVSRLKQVIELYDEQLETVIIGYLDYFISNASELEKAFESNKKVEILSLKDLKTKLEQLDLS